MSTLPTEKTHSMLDRTKYILIKRLIGYEHHRMQMWEKTSLDLITLNDLHQELTTNLKTYQHKDYETVLQMLENLIIFLQS